MNRNCSTDFGPNPYVTNIECATKHNKTYRTSLWTGKYLQTTLMSIPVRGDVGLECHPETDQFFRIEQGTALVKMGSTQDNLSFSQRASNGYAIFIPAGTWHNIINVGSVPLKMYSIYAPPKHPFCTVQQTK